MAELLLELLSEEIPARMQARAAEDLEKLVLAGLDGAGLSHERTTRFVTPRRVGLVVEGLPQKQPDTRTERKGPRVGSPDQAIQGFLKSVGLTSTEECEVREVKGTVFYFAVVETEGRETARILGEIVSDAIRKLPWPKSMRWGANRFAYVRPLQNILCIFDGWPVDGSFDLCGDDTALPFTPKTVGHRFLGPDEILVQDFEAYRTRLYDAKVIVSPSLRRETIWREATALAERRGLTVREDPALLDEVTGLVEWPVPLMGAIDDAFMDLPPEVLVTSMRSHQKYFALENAEGHMAPRFIVVANTPGAGDGKAVVAGNERVLRARLSDAMFFWQQDRSRPLAERAPALKDITFHARLGTLDAKVDRVEALAGSLLEHVPGADRDRTQVAARLAKADLTTGMVGEFPELQGIMGRYYALHDGEHEEVANAIAEHYAPQGPSDTCPRAPVSVAVSLADKIDTLVGFFAIDEKPTGSKDPYALRRAALGVIRLILENELRMPLAPVFVSSLRLHRIEDGPEPARLAADLLGFFADRLKVHLRDQGVRHDLVSAIFALGDEDDLVRLLARVDALKAFLASDDGSNLLVAYRRAANIVRIESKKDKKGFEDAPDPTRFVEATERDLGERLHILVPEAQRHVAEEDFAGAMTVLAGLRQPLDAFFEDVTVNADDPALRENRLRLLAEIQRTMDTIADFSRVEG